MDDPHEKYRPASALLKDLKDAGFIPKYVTTEDSIRLFDIVIRHLEAAHTAGRSALSAAKPTQGGE